MKSETWKVIHSSADNCWRTPPEVFEPLNARFGFDLDAAALQNSHLCDEWFGPDHPDESRRDALSADWGAKKVWLNPPYGRGIGEWIKKAYEECQKGATVVCLTMACTDTAWWHDYAWKAANIYLVRGRIRFLRANGERAAAAPKGSAIIVFRPDVKFVAPHVSVWP